MKRNEVITHLKGVFPPVVTPYNRQGAIDEGRYRANLERYAESGLSGIVVAGSTGEAPYLTERERLRLVEVARKVVRSPQVLIVGAGLESTRETLRLSREAVARGADVVLLLTPNYFKSRMDSAALLAHFRTVADGVTRPAVIYSIPQFTGIRMEADTVGRLSRHPNIAGIKESSGDLRFVRAILRLVRPGFRVLVGAASIFLDGLRAGAVGGVLGQANFAPELCVGIYDAFRRKRFRQARELERNLVVLVQKISTPYGVPGIKLAMDLSGYTAGLPRPPLLPLDGAARRAIGAALKQARAGLDY